MEPKISFASSSFDKALGFTPGMLSALRAEAPDCRWAVLRDWDSGRWAQRLLYMHSALFPLEYGCCVGSWIHTMSVEDVEGVDSHCDESRVIGVDIKRCCWWFVLALWQVIVETQRMRLSLAGARIRRRPVES